MGFVKLIKLKTEIKTLASDIRNDKKKRKEFSNGYVPGLDDKRYEVRHKHIAYCMLRGRSYDQIENPNEDNKANMSLVEKYMEKYDEKPEALRASG